MGFSLGTSVITLLAVFGIAAVGYLVGGIKIKGISLGTAAVFIVALVVGHFAEGWGIVLPGFVKNVGLVCFVTAVGFIAGPSFFRILKKNIGSYVLLGLLIIAAGAATCVGVVALTDVDAPLAVGLLSGALTSTPGFAAAQQAAGTELEGLVSAGYGIAYPFGVLGVLLFVQLIPKILRTDMVKERESFVAANAPTGKKYEGKLLHIDPFGFFAFALAVALGVLLGSVTIPLPGGANFSLGTTGGPLIAGLVIGHFTRIGRVSLTPSKESMETMREFGLMLFLIGAGVEGGKGFIEVLNQHGGMLFVYGALMTLVPMIVGYLFARYVLKLGLFNNLGAICGGMTSTPALGTLIDVTGTDAVASAYAATYPIALIAVVLASQFIVLLL